ncbi:MAG: twin-arginine translocation signal domain-containing protein [Acidobacteria bacterium]|nr:twin-arginine translocation signal domain-containing protein [Acidobacteriota bacterium]
MKLLSRRDFLKTSAVAAAALYTAPAVFTKGLSSAINFIDETSASFPLLQASGNHYEIGHAVGSAFSKNINTFLKRRVEWFNELIDYVQNDKTDYFIKLVGIAEEKFPYIVREMRGIAKGAGLDFEQIALMNLSTEISAMIERTKKAEGDENPGCSTFHLKNQKYQFIMHNEDGHDASADLMYMLHAKLASGTSYIAFMYPGMLAGVAPVMNSYGLGQTCNYIPCDEPKTGIPRAVLYRATVEAKSVKEAVKISTIESRAFAFHNNFCSFDNGQIVSLETIPGAYSLIETKDFYFHTNHNIHPDMKAYEKKEEDISGSSGSRLAVMTEEVKKLPAVSERTEQQLIGILSNHKQAPYSPCRHPRGNIRGITMGTAVMDINRKAMRMYKWNPCLATANNWITDYYLNADGNLKVVNPAA